MRPVSLGYAVCCPVWVQTWVPTALPLPFAAGWCSFRSLFNFCGKIRMTGQPLFQKHSLHSLTASNLAEAKAAVNRLSRDQLKKADLQSVLDQIVKNHMLECPKLDAAKKAGKRKDKTIKFDDFGETRTRTISVIEVTVPFTGEAQGFEIRPNQGTIHYGLRATIGRNQLAFDVTAETPDNTQAAVNTFVAEVTQMLDQLRPDIEKHNEDLKATVSAASRARLEQIRAEKDRDSGFDFKVD
jgi:hypothetical protein